MSLSQAGVLVANVVTTVTLDNVNQQTIAVTNRSGTGEIWFTVDGTLPTVTGGNSANGRTFLALGCRYVAAVQATPGFATANVPAVPTISMISSSALKYMVEGETT